MASVPAATSEEEAARVPKDQKITETLSKIHRSYFTIEATEGAAMEVDDEDATDRQQLQELTRKQSDANTKSLQQEL
jgi:hypothetical protein